jgi:hypothetical protein
MCTGRARIDLHRATVEDLARYTTYRFTLESLLTLRFYQSTHTSLVAKVSGLKPYLFEHVLSFDRRRIRELTMRRRKGWGTRSWLEGRVTPNGAPADFVNSNSQTLIRFAARNPSKTKMYSNVIPALHSMTCFRLPRCHCQPNIYQLMRTSYWDFSQSARRRTHGQYWDNLSWSEDQCSVAQAIRDKPFNIQWFW